MTIRVEFSSRVSISNLKIDSKNRFQLLNTIRLFDFNFWIRIVKNRVEYSTRRDQSIFNLDQIRRRIDLTTSIVLIKLNLFIKLASRMSRLSNRSINQKMKKIIIITKMRIEITKKNRKNHDTMSTTSIS